MDRRGQFIGLMSGTSVDAIDAALVNFDAAAPRLVGHHSAPLDHALRDRILALSRGTDESVHELCSLDSELGSACSSQGRLKYSGPVLRGPSREK